MAIKTLAERKAAAVAAKQAGLAALRVSLGQVARGLGGRFLLIGSAARGALRFDSDIDLLLDFADGAPTSAAWTVAENECTRLGLPCDIRPVQFCDERFLAHVLPDAQPIP